MNLDDLKNLRIDEENLDPSNNEHTKVNKTGLDIPFLDEDDDFNEIRYTGDTNQYKKDQFLNDNQDEYEDDEENCDDYDNHKKKKKIIIVSIVLILLLCTGGAATYFLLNQKINIPDYSGKTIKELSAYLKDKKYESDNLIVEYVYDDVIPNEVIIDQSIKNDKVSKNDKINIVVSKGVNPEYFVTIPDFKNKTEAEIKEFLETNKFEKYNFEYIKGSDSKDGTYVDSNLANTLDVRNEITVYIATNDNNKANYYIMPSLIGQNKDKAVVWAKENNISFKYIEQVNDEKKLNTILDTSTKAGQMFKNDSEIVITVSSHTKVEKFTGTTKREYGAWASKYNLTVSYLDMYSDTIAENEFIQMSPKMQSVQYGDKVKAYFSIGRLTMEDFSGKTEDDIKKWVNEINKKVYYSEEEITYKIKEVESDKKAGTIISTDPANKDIVKLGGTIIVNIAKEKPVEVTSKTNVSLNDFQKYLKDNGLEEGNKTTNYSDTIKAGYIISNKTGNFEKGSEIDYVVSLGAYEPAINDFNKNTLAKAQDILGAANKIGAGGWKISTTETYSNDISVNLLFDCSINTSGKTVACKLSKGKEPVIVNVNDYSGSSIASLRSFATANGLVLKETEQYSDTVSAGTIISNDTGSFKEGSTINVVVSKGPEFATIEVNAAQSAYVMNLSEPGNPETTKTNIINYIVNELGFATPTVNIIFNDEPSGAIIDSSLQSGSYKATTVFIFNVSKGIEN